MAWAQAEARLSWSPARPLAELELLDVDLDGRDELCTVSLDGHVEVSAWNGGEPQVLARLELEDPSRTLFTWEDVTGDGRPELVVLGESGLRAHQLTGEGFGAARLLLARARLAFRTDFPRRARLLRDVNQDAAPDLVFPTLDGCELWLASTSDEASEGEVSWPSFRRAARLANASEGSRSFVGDDLSDRLFGRVAVSDIYTRDMNADGREDLIVSRGDKHAWHMQRDDGTYPRDPDTSLDLRKFKDPTPEPELAPGEIVPGSSSQLLRTRDLDGDGVLDHVIAHRRKVWVFRGTAEGPQFAEPATILRVAEDVTGMLLVSLDDDERPDLLLVKVVLPGIAELLTGLAFEWDVSFRVLGYKGMEGARFSTRPSWSRELNLVLPPVLDVVRHPERFIEQFQEVSERFRAPTIGDFDGDGDRDVVLVSEDGEGLELFKGEPGDAEELVLDGERQLRKFLFETEVRSWDLDRLLVAVASLAGELNEVVTSGREPTRELPLRQSDDLEWIGRTSGDLDGDGDDELLVIYSVLEEPRRLTVDVLQLD